MDMNLYNFSGDRRKLNKYLTHVADVTIIAITNDTNILRPSIIINTRAFNFNYVYIPNFGRYYYVDNIKLLGGERIGVDCSVDVLMSHKAAILSSQCIAERSSSSSDPYLQDDKVASKDSAQIYDRRMTGNPFNTTTYVIQVAGRQEAYMAELYRYEDAYHNELLITDAQTVDPDETYLTLPTVIGVGYNTNLNLDKINDFVINEINPAPAPNGRYCIIQHNNVTYGLMAAVDGYVVDGAIQSEVAFTYRVSPVGGSEYTYTGNAYPGMFLMSTDPNYNNGSFTEFSTNIPIFTNETWAKTYITAATTADIKAALTHAINYSDSTLDEDTKYYYIENQRGMADTVRNTATPTGNITYKSMRFMSNATPLLYFNNDYSLTLVAPSVLASYALDGPLSIIDMVPESSWHDGLMYTGLWYGNIATRLKATGENLADGSYMYGFDLGTNILIMPSKAAAEQAIESGDYSEAFNYAQVSEGGSYHPPAYGNKEETTEFGGGADTSPFVQTYVLDRSALIQLAQTFYSTSEQTWRDILTGLSLVSSDKPIEGIAGITMYPFDVNKILNTSPQQYVYMGTYQLTINATLHKAISLKSAAYLDCGSVTIRPLTRSYKDYKNTTIQVYLPYIGWQKMDPALIYDKTITVRYYVDIHTRACVACIIANGILIAQYSGNIGVCLPSCNSDYNAYANAMASTVMGGASSVLSAAGGAIQAATAGTSGLLTAAVGIGSAAANTAATLNKLERMGGAGNHPTVTGAFTACIGTYMPQYVIWRTIIHDTVAPNNFNELCGRPSSTGASVGSFSGFLSCKSVNLNTNLMLDEEAAEVYNLLKGGIYI